MVLRPAIALKNHGIGGGIYPFEFPMIFEVSQLLAACAAGAPWAVVISDGF